MDACASRTLVRFFLDRPARLRLAAALGRLHDDAVRTQSRARRPRCHVSAVSEDRLERGELKLREHHADWRGGPKITHPSAAERRSRGANISATPVLAAAPRP